MQGDINTMTVVVDCIREQIIKCALCFAQLDAIMSKESIFRNEYPRENYDIKSVFYKIINR